MGRLLQLLAPHQPSLRGLVKIGEGTYGEAFKHGGNVYKIVPIQGTAMINNAAQKNAAEMAAELAVAFALTSLGRAGGVYGECGALRVRLGPRVSGLAFAMTSLRRPGSGPWCVWGGDLIVFGGVSRQECCMVDVVLWSKE